MRVSLPVLQQKLEAQQELRAVERFASLHESGDFPAGAHEYDALIPLSLPKPGEQYAFKVDLDACSGCKACVTACHTLNGLDEGETWRFVGVLHGGTTQAPVVQTVTSACHHCLDPACMNGCPVEAYEKDPVTGIVRHLDDQCIGCQYCTLTCPYDVPQYNVAKGIVRKCDMCSDRLAEGEAPACVQACPNQAISITVVSQAQVIEDAQGDAFLPGAPSPGITVPTTVYDTERAVPRNLLPVDFYALRPAQDHAPLVAMLVLTQLAVGGFVVEPLLDLVADAQLGAARTLHVAVSLLIGLTGIHVSLLHLGRPLYAFRAVIGLRRSWLSREILAFGAFAGVSTSYAAALWFGMGDRFPWLGPMVAAIGLGAVFCSTMVYAATRRVWWNAPTTAFKFFMTTIVLGLGLAAVTSAWRGDAHVARIAAGWAVAAALLKLIGEASVFLHLHDRTRSDLKRSALLLTGTLARAARWRVGLALSGVAVLLVTIALSTPAPADAFALGMLTLAAALLLTAGEVLERVLFFRALSSSRMPGSLH